MTETSTLQVADQRARDGASRVRHMSGKSFLSCKLNASYHASKPCRTGLRYDDHVIHPVYTMRDVQVPCRWRGIRVVPREHGSRPFVWTGVFLFLGVGEALELSVKIRLVEPRDAEAVAGLWQALSDYHSDLDPRLPAAVPGAKRDYAARMLERCDDPKTRALVAEVDGHVVGYVLGAIVDLHPDLFDHVDAGFIADVFVHEHYREQGIASQLVVEINRWFESQGIRHVELQVAAANTPGIDFWDAQGALAVMVRMRIELDEYFEDYAPDA